MPDFNKGLDAIKVSFGEVMNKYENINCKELIYSSFKEAYNTLFMKIKVIETITNGLILL